MMKIAICDDSVEEVNMLKQEVECQAKCNQQMIMIDVYTRSCDVLDDIREGKKFDIILSDIVMPNIDGMGLVSDIRRYLPEVIVIFITGHMEYAIDAYELSVFRYIPKNSWQERLPQALRDVFQMIHVQDEQYYTICTSNRLEKIPMKKIIYIQKQTKNSIFHLTDGKVIKERKSLNQIYESLGGGDFVFIDRGVIVNLLHIKSIHRAIVEMDNEEKLPASGARLEDIKSRLREFWSSKM